MASLSNINGIFDVHSTGAILFSNTHGTTGQILRSNGDAAPTWVNVPPNIDDRYVLVAGDTMTGNLALTDATNNPSLVISTGSLTVGGVTTLSSTSTSTLTINGRATFPSAVANRPQLPGGFLGLNTGDGNFDIWGISTQYYPSHATAANAWGLKWDGDSNQFRFVGNGQDVVTIDLDQGNFVTTGSITGTTATFTGLVSGITPTAAANFATKAYVDAQPQGDITEITVGNGLTGTSLSGPIPDLTMSGSYTGAFSVTGFTTSTTGFGINYISGATVTMIELANAPGYGIYYREATPDYIEFKHNNVVQQSFDGSGNVTMAGDLTVSGGDITLGGTGRIQGIDTVTASTDAANKAYVDAQPQGDLTSITLGNGLTGSSLSGPIPNVLMSGSYTGTFTATSLASDSFLNNAGNLLFSAGNTTTGASRTLNLRHTSGDPSSSDGSNSTGITWGQRTDSNPYYIIKPTQLNFGGGNYSKLTLNWHTGIRIGGQKAYGGTKFYNDAPDIVGETGVIMNVGVGNDNIGVVNALTVGGEAGIGTTVTTGGFNVNNANSGSYYNMSNSDSGNFKYTNPNGRLLTSNGTGWVADGRDPILTLSSAGNGGATTVGYSVGLNLYSDTTTNNTYSPLICFSNQSNSGNYATAYAAIGGKKVGAGTDSNWSTGELHFWTAGPTGSGSASYMQQASAMMIDDAGKVGISTTSPNMKLNVGASGGTGNSWADLLGVTNSTTDRAIFMSMYGGNAVLAVHNAALNAWADLYINTVGGTTGMVVIGNGNVGIGTSSPGYKLDVSGGGIKLDGKCALTDNAYFVGAPTHGFRWNSNNDAYNNVIMYDNGNMHVRGNVGIGVTGPTEKLVVAGKVMINNANVPNNLAQLNIGWTTSGGETRAIDIDGNWGGNESKSISFTHGTTATNIVGQINCQHNGPGSRIRWGKLYHSGDSSTYTMELISTSQTAANLTVAGNITAAADVVAYSDERLKSNIKTLDGSKVLKMRGVSFEKDGKKGSGVIAQELEKVAPELVNNDNEYKGVAYGNLTGYLIEAIKELEARVKELENK